MRRPDDGPCPLMRPLLSRLSDGTLGGIARWYARHHAAGCPGCAAALVSLVMLRERLRALGVPESEADVPPPLTPERRVAVEAEWARVDITIHVSDASR